MTSSNEEIRSVNELLKEIDELREKGEYYKSIIESTNKGVWVISVDGKTVYVNYRMAAMLGYTIDEVMGESIFEFIDEDHRSQFKSRLAGCKAECYEQFDLKFRRKDGKEFWALAGLRPFFDRSGKNIGVNGTFVDITDRKLMEMALRETRDHLEKAQRVGKMGCWVIDIKTNKIVFSEELRNILGVQKTLVSMEDVFDHIYDPDKEVFRRKVYELEKEVSRTALSDLENKGFFKSDVRIVRGDGRIIHCYVEANLTRDMDGRPDKVVGVLQDITERKLAEEALQESEEKFRTLVETAPMPILFHRGVNFIYTNPAAEKIFGYSTDDMLKIKFWDLFAPEFRELVKERGLARLRGENPPSNYEVRLQTNLEEKWMELTPVRVMYKGSTAILTLFQDVTQYKQALTALHDSKEEAELYVDLMSHDISNINQAGMGNLELLQDTVKLDAQGQERVSTALQAFEKSTELIKNVKKLQKVKKGDMHLEKIDIGQVLDKVKNDYPTFPGRDITIRLESNGACFVYADRLLYDVFSNIVDNSIKYSKDPVEINISLNSVKIGDNKFYQVSIEDNGPGIKPDLKKRIFNRMFYEGGIMRGKGLGLYLVKTLVECFQGNVFVEDRIQGDHTKGARFVVMLPAFE